ncbi:MAG: cellulase family glycosylhydrolase [Deltaproteobacteria bacterium]|nr:cellulase family glycosylhydrolase [Deltaproteobacteria bacterium]
MKATGAFGCFLAILALAGLFSCYEDVSEQGNDGRGDEVARGDGTTDDASHPSDVSSPSDVSHSSDANNDDGQEDTGDTGAPDLCEAIRGHAGWEVCEATATTCEGLYTDGAGCTAFCAAAGMVCTGAFAGDPGCVRLPDPLPCDSGHTSDWCVCSKDAVDGGPGDDGREDGGSTDDTSHPSDSSYPSDGSFDSGPEDAGSLPKSAVPQIHPDDPHRFVKNGKTWYPAGYYPGAALNMTGDGYNGDFRAFNEAFMDKLAAGGADHFRIWFSWGAVTSPDGASLPDNWDRHILTPWERTGPGNAADGKPKLNLDRFNQQYFDLISQFMSYTKSNGLVVQVMLLDCWHSGFGLKYGFADLDFFAAQNNVNGVSFSTEAEWLDTGGRVWGYNRAFVKRVVEVIGGYENIVWETCNEMKAADTSTFASSAAHPFHKAVAQAIHEAEQAAGHPRHLVMPVDLPEHRTVAGHRTPTNGGGSEESIDAMHGRLAGTQWAWNVPLITDNDCCPGEPDADFVRRKAWAALTAGAHIDVFNNEMFTKSVVGNQNTAKGIRYVGYLRKFLADMNIDLAGFAPADGAASAGWTLSRGGSEFIVYLDGAGSVSIDSLPPAFDAKWFNPRDGTSQPASGGPSFAAPSGGDWVLHVRAR